MSTSPGRDEEQLLARFLAAVEASQHRALAIFLPDDRPGRPWDDHAILEHGEVAYGTVRGRIRHAPAPGAIEFTITGIASVTPAAHPWSSNALRLTGAMRYETRTPRPSVLGIARAPRSWSRDCDEIWLVAQP